MAWGYERSFTIEHDTTVKRRIDCKDCNYYERSDKSCMKRPLYLPEDGYHSWRTCDYFELDTTTSHYAEKKEQYASFLKRKFNELKKKEAEKKCVAINQTTVTKESKKVVDTPKKIEKSESSKVNFGKGYRVVEVTSKLPKGENYESCLVAIELLNRKKIKVLVVFDKTRWLAYVNKNCYTQEAIERVRKKLSQYMM